MRAWPRSMCDYEKGDTLFVFRSADDCYKVRNAGKNPRISLDYITPVVCWPPHIGRAMPPLPLSIPDKPFPTRHYVCEDIDFLADLGVIAVFYRERVQ